MERQAPNNASPHAETMNDQRKGMKKCPEEIKRQIYHLAGPFTKYLNGRLELSSEFNKRLIRRDAILMGWKGDYSELFSFAGYHDFHKVVADIVINQSKGFHEWLVQHLESNYQFRELYNRLHRLYWKEWWQDPIRSSDHNQLRCDFENAIEYCHVEIVQFIMTKEELRKKVSQQREDETYFVERFIEICRWRNSRPVDVFEKSAWSKMLWTILQNISLNSWNRAMDAAAMIGDIEIVKWVHENIQDCCTTRTMNNAAENGHLEVVKWLHENRTEGCTTDAMDWAASKGHLEVVKWLHENRTEGCTKNAIDCAAYNGHHEVVKWLHEHCPALCNLQDALARATQENRQYTIQVISEIIASRQSSNDQL